MPRLFVAVWPPTDVADALRALDLRAEQGAQPVSPDKWHVTLRFLGDLDDGDASEVIARLDDADLPSATAVLGPTVERLGRGPLVVPVAGLDDLARAVEAVTGDLGLPPRPQFVGHLTVVRTTRGARSSAFGRPIEARFEVGEVALVESDLTPRGAVYTTRHRVTVGSPDGQGS